ncbi:hypothetical protein Tco_1155707 [Tanacetum coccineum]
MEKNNWTNGVFGYSSHVWICQISQENSQKRTRERMSDQEAKEIKAEAREIMPQPSTLLKEISNAVKDDPAINQKLNEATETFTRISSNVTEENSLLDCFLIRGKFPSLGRVILRSTHSIKSMMTEMYAAFQDTPFHTEGETEEPRLEILISSIPSTAILPTQAQPITSIIIHPKSSQATTKIDKGKGIATDSGDDPSKKLVKASSIVRPDLDEPVRDKEEQIKKAEEEARLNAISKLEVIKVVRKEAKKLGIHPKEAITTKAGELFKKAQDAEHEVLKKQHTKKVRKSLELRKHKYDNYMWTVSSRLKPEPVTDIKIHPKTKPVVITVYRGTGGRNFDAHKPFLFEVFGKFPGELGIQLLFLLQNDNTPSQCLRRNTKHMELEPKTRIPGLKCNRALPENVPFLHLCVSLSENASSAEAEVTHCRTLTRNAQVNRSQDGKLLDSIWT